ncbi:high frequency lysogenization protein HflD [Methylomarinum sp. Ch1-1]|uniref:High frequency lysogenization protein HflD homolog n=1 Tax=Methylomarinum roseum TaxID=3067653 RepID=A0AAU7NTW2_9GAMM|nr:high frequency lysogenization protein HflD [Methylomarinum sp. Ch1-1]MDP4519582.1 high frequency lysogenization protein HflD [Methylomarinum sp. Ch1-1]
MSVKNITNQTIALAGIAQACSLVQQLATTGSADDKAVEASVGSLLKIDADSVVDVYGGLSGIEHGLQQLEKQMTGRSIANPEQARYAASLVYLERQLVNRPEMLKSVHNGIEKAQGQAEHFGLLHENVLASLGDLYHSTISTIPPRIMINGEPEYLSNQNIVNKIRTLLLAGIRSALLWRQCGGARWKFLLFRKKLQDEIKFLLTQL